MKDLENKKALNEAEEEAVSGGDLWFVEKKLNQTGKEKFPCAKSPISLGEGIPVDSTSDDKPRDGGATGGW